MKKIYLSGPMTGLPALNFPAFAAMTANLRDAGHAVTNPAELNPACVDGVSQIGLDLGGCAGRIL